MNIEKLLKKLDKSAIDNKRDLLTVQTAYKLKTSQSIGTLNSVDNLNERSFVVNDAQTPHGRKIGTETLSANSKLDQELSNIEKMKNLYQSRQLKSRLRTKSIQKNSTSGKKSFEKHLLKPSNTPSFNKSQKDQLIQRENDSACKNLYKQQMLQNSQISHTSNAINVNHIKVAKKSFYQYPDSGLHIQEPQAQPYEDEQSYNEQSLSQIGHIEQDLVCETNPQKSRIKEQFQEQKQQKISDPVIVNVLQTKPILNLKHCNCQCSPRAEIQSLVANFEQKVRRLTQKVQKLQLQSRQPCKSHIKIQNENVKLQLALAETNEQKQKALIEAKKYQLQKEQLQVLLKDVLYKRQREKMQSSKQNTYRQNQKNDKKLNNYSFVQSQSQSELKPTRNISNSQMRQSQSKMKVQNLLHKLQIKVDRV